MKWFSSRSLAAKIKTHGRLKRNTAYRPAVEALEDRLVPSGFYGFNINYYGTWVQAGGAPAGQGAVVIEGSDKDNYVHITEVPYQGSTLLRIDYAPWHFDQAHPDGFTLKSEMHTLLYSEDTVQTVYYLGGNGRDFFQNESLTTTWAWGDRDHGGTDDNPREPTFGGDDVLIGGLGGNHLFGGGGNDILVSNTKYGGIGQLTHFNGEFHPVELERYKDNWYSAELYGQGGDDILIASKPGFTYLSGGSGNDKLFGGGGNSNVMYGGEGDDLLDPGMEDLSNFNDNVMFGFVGADTFVVRTTHDVVADFHRESLFDGDRVIVPWEKFLTLTGGGEIQTVGLLSGTPGNFSGNQLVGSMSLDVAAAADQTALSQPIDLSMTDILAAINLPADADSSDVIDVGQQINAAIGDRVETIDADSATAPFADAPADIVQLVSGFVEASVTQVNLVTTEANIVTESQDNTDPAPVAGSVDIALQPSIAQTAQDLLNEVSSTDSVDPSAIQVPVTESDAALSVTVDAAAQETPVVTQPNVVTTEPNVIDAALNSADSAPVAESVDQALTDVNTAQTTADLLNQVSSTDSVDASAAPLAVTVAASQDTPVATQPTVVTPETTIVTAAATVSQQSTGTSGTGYLGLAAATTSSLLSRSAVDSFFAAPVSYRVNLFGR